MSGSQLILMHSDGISTRFDLEPYRTLGTEELAKTILANHGRTTTTPRASSCAARAGAEEAVEEVISLSCDADAVVVQNRALRFARAVGFADRTAWEVAIAASELATNVVKYGIGGRLVLRDLESPRRGSR